MSTNYRQFELDLRRFTEKLLPEQIERAVRLIGTAVLLGVVEKTPVDTGRARANWQVELNAVNAATTEDTDPGGGQALAAGLSALAQFRPGDTVYISNHLVYIVPLENGHSQQAPQGMVALTIAEVQAQFSGR